ncbi:coagulation factor V-like [Lineus longissimus]|uniref:coagulation factor V-like n=1 Tax=Lineus longissimus TaxID=88925 RepID=UPI00315CD945
MAGFDDHEMHGQELHQCAARFEEENYGRTYNASFKSKGGALQQIVGSHSGKEDRYAARESRNDRRVGPSHELKSHRNVSDKHFNNTTVMDSIAHGSNHEKVLKLSSHMTGPDTADPVGNFACSSSTSQVPLSDHHPLHFSDAGPVLELQHGAPSLVGAGPALGMLNSAPSISHTSPAVALHNSAPSTGGTSLAVELHNSAPSMGGTSPAVALHNSAPSMGGTSPAVALHNSAPSIGYAEPVLALHNSAPSIMECTSPAVELHNSAPSLEGAGPVLALNQSNAVSDFRQVKLSPDLSYLEALSQSVELHESSTVLDISDSYVNKDSVFLSK